MGEDAILEVAQVVENWQPGDLGIEFLVRGGGDEMSLMAGLFRLLASWAEAACKNAPCAANDDDGEWERVAA